MDDLLLEEKVRHASLDQTKVTRSGRPRCPAIGPSARPGSELASHAPALCATAAALCRSAAECEDLVQDTLERALRHMEGGNGAVRNMRAWLVAILRNAFVDRVRSERATTADLDDCPAVEPDPQPAWANVTLADVRAAAAALEPDLRAVFEMRYLDGLRYREIAHRLGVAENTIASRLFRARRALRDMLLALSGREPSG